MNDAPACAPLNTVDGSVAVDAAFGRSGRWIVRIITVALVVFTVCPWMPAVSSSTKLDPSWVLALSDFAAAGRHWGRDVVFTYGPLGYLGLRTYHPGTWTAVLLFQVALGVVLGLAVAELAICGRLSRVRVAVLLVLLTAFLSVSDLFNTLFIMPPVLLLIYHWRPGGRGRLYEWLLVSAVAVLALGKFTAFVSGAVVVLAIALDDVLRQRRIPWTLPLYVVSLLGAWICAGQDVGDLPLWVRTSMELTSGYSAALAYWRHDDLAFCIAYWGLALLLAGGMAGLLWGRLRWWVMLPLGAMLFLLFTLFKGGMVRLDGHILPSLATIALAGLFLLAGWHGQSVRWARMVVVAAVVATCTTFVVASKELAGQRHITPLFILRDHVREQAARLLDGSMRDEGNARRYAEAMAEIRRRNPVAELQGSVDIYTSATMLAPAHGWQYDNRPVFQSNMVYSPMLAALNARHLEEGGPDHLVVRLEPIDNHLPLSEDALAWPAMLKWYNLRERRAKNLVLDRREQARAVRHTMELQRDVAMGERLDLPDRGVLFMQIGISPTMAGRAKSLLYKPPIVLARLELADGSIVTHRIVPGMVEAGAIVSPLITRPAELALLLEGADQQRLAKLRVRSITFQEERTWIGSVYRTGVAVQVWSLEY